MKDSTFGWLALIVRGNELDVQKINELTALTPTVFKNKNENIFNSKDTWIYKEMFAKKNNTDSLSEIIRDTLALFLKKIKTIDVGKLKNLGQDVYITFYLSSDFAQIRFAADNHLMRGLFELGLEVDFSIFSFGKVEDKDNTF
ncbi:MAG: DUF4279 domain-containing protein [Oscillospiraceae bacterium]|nr:DUF4279 domain-containing protein [Oscillospiraceae bacterium]